MSRSISSTPLRATVIGAGVAGLTTALTLAERGVAGRVGQGQRLDQLSALAGCQKRGLEQCHLHYAPWHTSTTV